MTLVVGLGNPGTGYANTKHNFGFWVVDQFIQNRSLKYKSGKGDYLYAKSGNLILAKPTTYMNNSGVAVGEICQYFNVSSNRLSSLFGIMRLHTTNTIIYVLKTKRRSCGEITFG